MSNGIIIGRRRVKPRFIFFISAIFICVFYLMRSCNKPPVPYAIELGEMDLEYDSDAILIRDEEAYTAPEYGRVVYYANEEEQVDKGDLVATIFKANYQEEMVYQLYNTQEKIISYQQENILKNITDQDIKNIQLKLDDLIYDVQIHIKNGSLSELTEKEKEFRNLLQQRQRLVDRKTVPDGYLKKLYEQEEKITQQLKEWKIDISAPKSGLISYHTDELETILNFNALDKIDLDTYRDLIDWKIPSDTERYEGQAEVDSPFFRIIDPGKWYIVCEVKYPKIFFKENERITISFLDFEDKALEGHIRRIVAGNNSFLLIIEFDERIEEFINIRNTSVRVGKTAKGLAIPKNAIIDRKGDKGVFKIKGDDMIFVPVDIVAESQEEDYIIIDRGTSLLEENDIININ